VTEPFNFRFFALTCSHWGRLCMFLSQPVPQVSSSTWSRRSMPGDLTSMPSVPR